MSDFREENEKDINIEGQDLLDIRRCDEKLSSKIIKGKINREILPDLEKIENSNDRITSNLDEIMNEALNEDGKLFNANEEALQTLAELLIYHSVIGESINSIRNTTKKL